MNKIENVFDALKELAKKKNVEMPDEMLFLNAIQLRVSMKEDLGKFFVPFKKYSKKPITPKEPNGPATENQMNFIKDNIPELEDTEMTAGEAHRVISEYIAKNPGYKNKGKTEDKNVQEENNPEDYNKDKLPDY